MLYKLKVAAKRGALLSTAAFVAVAAYLPAPAAFADALNPLTDRSLTLSSSSPGWDYMDGSGNPTYAQPNSGANGKQTGNTFDFKVSSTKTVKGMTFQYCTTSAGECYSPGDNGYTGSAPSATRNGDSATTSDLKVVFPSPDEVDPGDFSTVVDDASTDGAVKAVPGFTDPLDPANTTGQYAASAIAGNFVVYVRTGASTWAQSDGWTLTPGNKEDAVVGDADGATNQNNYITLKNTGGEALTAGQEVKVVFFGTTNNYIQNPGSGAFFVKINTYDSDTTQDDTTLVDGGVTVANVMNHSIRIQTKVLETMKFSVGTVDPNTLSSADGVATPGSEVPSSLEKAMFVTANDPLNPDTFKGATKHTPCDAILGGKLATDPVNVLKLGDQSAESSLSDNETYATHSYWRLSSNSSAGATVYYSGVTLSNTVGDKISAIGPTKAYSAKGSEQFGLALMNGNDADSDGTYEPSESLVDYVQQRTAGSVAPKNFENGADNDIVAIHASADDGAGGGDVGGNSSWHTPMLYPLVPQANYESGNGTFQDATGGQFAFDETSNSIPVPLATEDSQVVDCVTGKMRYIANIASTTPAGIYTTAVNYIAAPQY